MWSMSELTTFWSTTMIGELRTQRTDYPRLCTGEGIFELATTTLRATASSPTALTISRLPMGTEGDYWENISTTWTRHHKNYRHDHDHPADAPVGGPGINYFDGRRITLKLYQDDDYETHVEDSWKESLRDGTTGMP